jgi:tripartite-type tricarboxylate transporter receptor subunit TctC
MTQHVSEKDVATTDPTEDESVGAEQPPPERAAPSALLAGSIVAGFTVLAVGASVLGGDLLNPPASTTDGDYAGETIEMMIPLAEGGGTDTWARFVASELTEQVPGSPGLAPVNDDGGEGILGTNHFMTSARTDGTDVLVSTASTVVPYLLDLPAVRYDFNELRPILANGTGAVVYARTGAGVRGVEDLVERDRPLIFGGIAATSLDLTTMLAFDLLSADVDATFGFEGRGPVNLALQRGEVDIDYQTTSSYGPAVEPLVEDGSAVPLFSLGQVDESGAIVRDPNFPELPTVVEAYEKLYGAQPDPEALETYRSILGLTYTYQKALWVPEDTPDEAVELLRSTAEEMGSDAEFQRSAAEVLGGYPLDASADLDERIGEAYRVDESVRQDVIELLENDYDLTIEQE